MIFLGLQGDHTLTLIVIQVWQFYFKVTWGQGVGKIPLLSIPMLANNIDFIVIDNNYTSRSFHEVTIFRFCCVIVLINSWAPAIIFSLGQFELIIWVCISGCPVAISTLKVTNRVSRTEASRRTKICKSNWSRARSGWKFNLDKLNLNMEFQKYLNHGNL